MNPQTKNKPNQPEYKDKPMEDLQDKNTQHKDKGKSKQGQGVSSTIEEEGCCG